MKKPGLFARLKNAISSTLNEAVDSMTDPGQEVALMLDDLAEQIAKSEKDLRQAMVDRKVMERKLEEIKAQEANWDGKAEQALKHGQEELARAALVHKTEAQGRRRDTEQALLEQKALVDSMQAQVKEAKSKLKSLNLRRGSLMNQARAAKQVSTGSLATGGAASRIHEIEHKIAEIEAMNEVVAEDVEQQALETKLAELSGKTDVDDALAQLKAKLERQALPSGESKS